MNEGIIHAYVHWLADVMGHSKKRKKTELLVEKSLTNCRLLQHKQSNM